MTTSENFIEFDQIGRDLVQSPENFKSPDWHAKVLQQREAGIINGNERIIDWEDAKKSLAKATLRYRNF